VSSNILDSKTDSMRVAKVETKLTKRCFTRTISIEVNAEDGVTELNEPAKEKLVALVNEALKTTVRR